MLKRIVIYISCALLILVSAHVWAQEQIDAPVEILFSLGPAMSFVTDDSVFDYGVLPWPADGSGTTPGSFRDITCHAGIGTALIQLSVAPTLVDLNGVSPDQPVLPTYFKIISNDDAANDPFDLFETGLNTFFLDPATPLQTVPFQGEQAGQWHLYYYNLLDVQGNWQTFITWSIIAQ